jgi:acetolactate synthase-1/2/3 large subunit
VYRGALHECTDQAGMFSPVTKAQRRGIDALAAAHEALAAPQRPVYLEVPTDLLSAAAGRPEPVEAVMPVAAVPGEVEAAARALGVARRPLVWAGGGALRSGAGPAVAALAEALGAPVLTTYSARGLVGGHPLAVGLPPHVPEAGALWDEADAVVAVGSDFDGMMTQNWRMPAPPTLVAINVDHDDATKNYAASAVVVADARHGAEALASAVDGPGRAPWADLEALRAAVRARLAAEHPAEVAFLDAFAAAVPADAVVLADMCIPGYWLAGFHAVPAPRRLQYPMGWGTLGFAFPASLGAACAGAGPVVSVSGDGGFLFACGELATVAQERLPLTAVVVDDGGYGMLRFDQRRSGAARYGVDLRTPDFVALAESFGMRAEAVDGLAGDFKAALARHVADPEPSVLVARAALEPPPTTSPRWYRAA